MEELVEKKAQVPKIKEFLMKTRNLDLVKATGDSYWGCGASFRSTRVQENKTTGENTLGKICTNRRAQVMAATNEETPDPEAVGANKRR